MHENDPVERPPAEAEAGRRRGWRSAAGSVAIGFAVLAAKAKTLLALLAGAKWLLILPKIVLSGGSIVASVAYYALLFGGLKFGLILVAMILVHELGHWVTLRNMGVPVSLPYFIPGFGAFVAAKAPTPSAVHDAGAALAGPVFGIAAAALCWGYGIATGGAFWLGAAYIGFLINLFNLLPVPFLDGGTIAGTIDARLWLLGVVAFVVGVLALHAIGPVTILLFVVIVVSSLPRALAAWRGTIDPRLAAVPLRARIAVAIAYFALALVAGAGAVATHAARTPA